MKPIIFTTSMDTQVTLITWGVTIGLVLIYWFIMYKISRQRKKGDKNPYNKAAFILTHIVLIVPFILSFFNYVRQYKITDQDLIIDRIVNDIHIPLANITSVQALPDDFKLRKSIGTDGMFGFYGEFTNPEIGRFNIYAKNTEDLILVKTNYSGNIVLAPDDISILEHLPK